MNSREILKPQESPRTETALPNRLETLRRLLGEVDESIAILEDRGIKNLHEIGRLQSDLETNFRGIVTDLELRLDVKISDESLRQIHDRLVREIVDLEQRLSEEHARLGGMRAVLTDAILHENNEADNLQPRESIDEVRAGVRAERAADEAIALSPEQQEIRDYWQRLVDLGLVQMVPGTAIKRDGKTFVISLAENGEAVKGMLFKTLETFIRDNVNDQGKRDFSNIRSFKDGKFFPQAIFLDMEAYKLFLASNEIGLKRRIQELTKPGPAKVSPPDEKNSAA